MQMSALKKKLRARTSTDKPAHICTCMWAHSKKSVSHARTNDKHACKHAQAKTSPPPPLLPLCIIPLRVQRLHVLKNAALLAFYVSRFQTVHCEGYASADSTLYVGRQPRRLCVSRFQTIHCKSYATTNFEIPKVILYMSIHTLKSKAASSWLRCVSTTRLYCTGNASNFTNPKLQDRLAGTSHPKSNQRMAATWGSMPLGTCWASIAGQETHTRLNSSRAAGLPSAGTARP